MTATPATSPPACESSRRGAPAIFRPGQSNYNIGAGSGTARQNRWGDYSAAQTDPLDDVKFWTVQEYAGTNRNDFLAPSYAGPWETWWSQVDPATPPPTASTAAS